MNTLNLPRPIALGDAAGLDLQLRLGRGAFSGLAVCLFAAKLAIAAVLATAVPGASGLPAWAVTLGGVEQAIVAALALAVGARFADAGLSRWLGIAAALVLLAAVPFAGGAIGWQILPRHVVLPDWRTHIPGAVKAAAYLASAVLLLWAATLPVATQAERGARGWRYPAGFTVDRRVFAVLVAMLLAVRIAVSISVGQLYEIYIVPHTYIWWADALVCCEIATLVGARAADLGVSRWYGFLLMAACVFAVPLGGVLMFQLLRPDGIDHGDPVGEIPSIARLIGELLSAAVIVGAGLARLHPARP